MHNRTKNINESSSCFDQNLHIQNTINRSFDSYIYEIDLNKPVVFVLLTYLSIFQKYKLDCLEIKPHLYLPILN